jgi:hypothetical protein
MIPKFTRFLWNVCELFHFEKLAEGMSAHVKSPTFGELLAWLAVMFRVKHLLLSSPQLTDYVN